MHTQLNSPIIVNLLRKISILLELILASKQLLRAELIKSTILGRMYLKQTNRGLTVPPFRCRGRQPQHSDSIYAVTPPQGSPTPSHCGEVLILLGPPQRNATAFLSLLVLRFFCCTPSAKRNSMSKPIRVCPLLWTALGTNMVAKQLFSIEIKLPTSWDTWKRWQILQGGTVSWGGKKMGKVEPHYTANKNTITTRKQRDI